MTTKRYLWKEANNLHKKFTDEMYREFGHDIHPGYARIKIRPLLISGAAMIGNPKKKGVNRIYLPDNRISREKRQDDELDFLVTCAHESAHLLDRKLIQWTWEYHPKLPLSKRLFREDVAEYASLVFFNRFYPNEMEGALRITRDTPTRLFKSDPSLLPDILNAEVIEYQKIVREKTEEPVDYLSEEKEWEKKEATRSREKSNCF